ncbi:hypothetical protein [Rathayibacter sp. PhB192]|nr:hypothetical protein [Rathayibacter sp. PhB192]
MGTVGNMIALRADVGGLDSRALPELLRRLRRHRHVQVGGRQWIAVLPEVGSVLLTDGAELVLDVLVERRALLPIVIDALEAELRRDGFRERLALRWSTPDAVPIPFR